MDKKLYIKNILHEDVKTDLITRIAVFDFDGTLAQSPTPENGQKKYQDVTGQSWPHKGWWGRPESLDTEIFDIPMISHVISDYEKEKQIPNTLLVLLTGRNPKLSKQVEKILSLNGLQFDEYHYNNGGSTLDFKIKILEGLLNRYPNTKSLHMWEDRDEHITPFKAWGESKQIEFGITKVE